MNEEVKTKSYIYIDNEDNEHVIKPCILSDIETVIRLYNKIDTEFMFNNLPQPIIKYDKDGKVKLDKDGNIVFTIDKITKEPKLDYTKFNAMKKLLEMALNEEYDELSKWVNMEDSVDIIDKYVGVSQLKKKMEQMIVEKMATLQNSLPQ